VGINMICIKTEIPQETCDIDDEIKANYLRTVSSSAIEYGYAAVQVQLLLI